MASQQDMQALNQLWGGNVDWASILGPDYGQAQQNASNNALANIYGYYMNGQPANGTPTLEADKLTGMFQGNPLAAEQEAYGIFGPNMGYLAGKPTLAAAEALGSVNGSPTLAAQQDYGYSNGAAGTGTRTLQGQQLDYGTAMDAMKLLGSLQSNPFAMERVARGIDSTGIPNALKGLMQGGAIPGFQAPQAAAQAPSLAGSLGIQGGAAAPSGAVGTAAQPVAQQAAPQSFAQQAQSAGLDLNTLKGLRDQFGGAQGLTNLAGAGNGQPGQPSQGAMPPNYFNFLRGYARGGPDFDTSMKGEASGLSGLGGGPATADPTSPDFDPAAAAGINMDATTAAAPAPNKLNAVNYTAGPQSLKDFIDSLYTSMGYSPTAVSETAKAQLPGFTAPRYGVVNA